MTRTEPLPARPGSVMAGNLGWCFLLSLEGPRGSPCPDRTHSEAVRGDAGARPPSPRLVTAKAWASYLAFLCLGFSICKAG